MPELRLVNENIEQLNGHIQLVRQGTQSAIAAATSAFGSPNRKAAAGIAIDICDDVAALCDYCTVIAGLLLEQTEGMEHEQVVRAINTIEELSNIASRTRRLAEIASHQTGSAAIHPSIRGTLREFSRRVAVEDIPVLSTPPQQIHRAG